MSKQLKRVSITKRKVLYKFNTIKDENGFYYDAETLEYLVDSYYKNPLLEREIENLKYQLEMLK